MVEGMLVDITPLTVGEGADQEEERRLRLMEVGDKLPYNLELVAWSYDNLRGSM